MCKTHNPPWSDAKGNSKTEKEAKKNKVIGMLKYWNIHWISHNYNTHIYFWIDEIRFDIWSTTELMWIKEGSNKHQVIRGLEKILTLIETEWFKYI